MNIMGKLSIKRLFIYILFFLCFCLSMAYLLQSKRQESLQGRFIPNEIVTVIKMGDSYYGQDGRVVLVTDDSRYFVRFDSGNTKVFYANEIAVLTRNLK